MKHTLTLPEGVIHIGDKMSSFHVKLTKLIIKCLLNGEKILLIAGTGMGKSTYVIEHLVKAIYKELSLKSRMVYPTNALADNKTKNNLKGDGVGYWFEKFQYGEMIYDHALNGAAADDIKIIDEGLNLIRANGYRDIMSKLYESENLIVTTATPSLLPYLGFTTIEVLPFEVKKKTINYYTNRSHQVETLGKFIANKHTKGNLTIIRRNSARHLERLKIAINEMHPDLNVAILFSEGKKGRDLGAVNDLNTIKIDDLKKLDVQEDVDVLLTTMLVDEGLDLESNGRYVDMWIVEPLTTIIDDDGDFKASFQPNVHPDELAQCAARMRNGKQTTNVIAGFGEDSWYKDEDAVSIEEEIEFLKKKHSGRTKRFLDGVAEIDGRKAKLNEDCWIEQCKIHNLEINQIDLPFIKRIEAHNQRDGELRKYIEHTPSWSNYYKTMSGNSRIDWIERTSEEVQVSSTLKLAINEICENELTLARLEVPFEWFISSTSYSAKTRDILVEVYTQCSNVNTDNYRRILKELVKLEDQKLDFIGWHELTKSQQSTVKAFINLHYKANRNYGNNIKSKNLIYTPVENELPEYVVDSMNKRQDREERHLKIANDRFWAARGK